MGKLVGKRVYQVLVGLAALIVLSVTATVYLWLQEHVMLAMGVGMFVVSIFLLLWTLAVFALGAYWSFVQYQAGADIAVRSQESDDQRDIAMMNALGRIIDVVIKSAPKISPPQEHAPPTFDRPQDFAPALRRLRPPLLDRDDAQ